MLQRPLGTAAACAVVSITLASDSSAIPELIKTELLPSASSSTSEDSADHIAGREENIPQTLATSALVFELVCHYGGSRFIVWIVPFANLDAKHLLRIRFTNYRNCAVQ